MIGGHVTAIQVTSVESERLADAFSREILVKIDLLAASEGKIELTAHREAGEFQRILLCTSTSSARRTSRCTPGDIRRLAMDVKAKVLAHAWKIDSATSKVTVAIHPRGGGYEIEVMVVF